MIEITCNDRLGKKVRIKCNPTDTIGDLKKLVAAQTGTRAEKIILKKWYTTYKDHITLNDYEIHDGFNFELMDSQTAPLFKNERTTKERAEKFTSRIYFTDCNLRGKLYGESKVDVQLVYYDAGAERISFQVAKKILLSKGKSATVGLKMGPTWSTHWFRVVCNVPKKWLNKRVHLIWNSGCEAMVWSEDGCPLQGLSGDVRRTEYRLPDAQTPLVLYVEVACNYMFGAGKGDVIAPPDPNLTFELKEAHLALFNEQVYELLMDFDVINGLINNLPKDSPERYKALYAANTMVNLISRWDLESLNRAQKLAEEIIYNSISVQMDFSVVAVANCHIDTAWLWPFEETKRKCARSWSSTIELLDEYPDLVFACSQALQFSWVEEAYPKLFEKIRMAVKEGRFVPVGGSWVESDGCLPGGESLIRQHLYGQQYFYRTFGKYCTEAWLPDTFGYSGQLPQIYKTCMMTRFVTQKLSWNVVNTFPNNSFIWQGIDGSQVIAHLPPGDSYVMEMSTGDILKSVYNFKDKGRAKSALMLYGHGDGGGGPDRQMCERLKRSADLPACPTVKGGPPSAVFENIEENKQNLVKWVGELYLEMHNGTYTTHAMVKRMNRTCEFLLRDCEFVAALMWYLNAKSSGGQWRNFAPEWKLVLQNQFHDVLPGTCIGDVYNDVAAMYDKVVANCWQFLDVSDTGQYLINTLGWTRRLVLGGDQLHEVPAFSVVSLHASRVKSDDRVEATVAQDSISMRNKFFQVELDNQGRVSFFAHLPDTRNLIKPLRPANQFVIFDDVPLYWDAWDVMDYHLETRKTVDQLVDKLTIVDQSDLFVKAEVKLRIDVHSWLSQLIVVQADCPYLLFETTVHWRESHKFLKVEFPLDVHSTHATYEIQFGHLARPNNRNTSWDSAKYEVCAQKWAALSEWNRGVAVLNDCKYGYSCVDNVLTLSLLRSSKWPDPNADMGEHKFSYALMAHEGHVQRPSRPGLVNVIQAAYELNSPVRRVQLAPGGELCKKVPFQWLTIDNPLIILESMKVAEAGDAIVLRLYESGGGHELASVRPTCFSFANVVHAYAIELTIKPLTIESDGSVRVQFEPFEIVTLLCQLNNLPTECNDDEQGGA